MLLLKKKPKVATSVVGRSLQESEAPAQTAKAPREAKKPPALTLDSKPRAAQVEGRIVKPAVPMFDLNDETGLDRSYADSSGFHQDKANVLYMAGTRGKPWEPEWVDNAKYIISPLARKYLLGETDAEIDVKNDGRYKEFNDYMTTHPEVRGVVAHSKAARIVQEWMQNNPERAAKLHARVYASPTDDPLGLSLWKDRLNTFNLVRNAEYKADRYANPLDKWLEDKVVEKAAQLTGLDKAVGMKESRVERIRNEGDLVAAFDNSATTYSHPTWYNYMLGGGPHDYHNNAWMYSGFDKDGSGLNSGDRPGGGAPDPNYRANASSSNPPQT
jgi:hypothetical protein